MHPITSKYKISQNLIKFIDKKQVHKITQQLNSKETSQDTTMIVLKVLGTGYTTAKKQTNYVSYLMAKLNIMHHEPIISVD